MSKTIKDIRGHDAKWSIAEVNQYIEDKAIEKAALENRTDISSIEDKLKRHYRKHLTLVQPDREFVIDNNIQVVLRDPQPPKKIING